jgi:hypothetical protein
MHLHPPKPLLALTVGVVGHRPNRLSEAAWNKIVAEVSSALGMIGGAADATRKRYAEFFEGEPRLSLVSPLAEGSDRIAAEAALAKGWTLDAILPFEADVYAADFDNPESQTKFRDLLSRARSVLTLPGNRGAADRAYEAAGLTVLSQSDILLAIWDGGPSAGRGGTTNNLILAARAGVPIIYVDAKGEAGTRLLWRGLRDVPTLIDTIDDCPSEDLTKMIDRLTEELIRPPPAETERASLRRYFKERAHGHNLRLEFPLLMTLLGVRSFQSSDLLPPKPDKLAAECAAYFDPAAGGSTEVLALAYGWADATGVQFAQTFRSAFVLNFIFAATAVVLAVASLFGPEKLWFVVPEIALILAIVFNTAIGRRQRWHQRWLEARELAERLRVALLLWILGSRPANFFSGDEPTWTGWYARAIIRGQAPRAGYFAGQGLSSAKSVVLKALKDQRRYHKINTRRMHRLDRRLEHIGSWSFVATLAAAGSYVLFAIALRHFNVPTEHQELVKHLVVALTAGLPALATATYGIRVIGDFEGIAKRSMRTSAVLRRLLTAMKREAVDLILLRAQAQAAADSMLGDLASWRLAVEARTLAIPG